MLVYQCVFYYVQPKYSIKGIVRLTCWTSTLTVSNYTMPLFGPFSHQFSSRSQEVTRTKYDGTRPPILAPSKFYSEYYNPLIMCNDKNEYLPNNICHIISEFTNGEIDCKESFEKSSAYSKLNKVISSEFHDKLLNIMNQKDNQIRIELKNNMDKNNNILSPIDASKLVSQFSLHNMDRIWYYTYEHTEFQCDGQSQYGEYFEYWGVIGEYKTVNNDHIYVKVYFSDYSDCYTNHEETLYFILTQSLDIFWNDILKNWKQWHEYEIKKVPELLDIIKKAETT
eukprot:69486_1